MLEICTHASANVHMSVGAGKCNKHKELLKGGKGTTEQMESEKSIQNRQSVNHTRRAWKYVAPRIQECEGYLFYTKT